MSLSWTLPERVLFMPTVGFALFWSFSCTCFFLAVGKCSFHGSQTSLPCRRQSSFIDRSSGFLSFSPASSNLALFAQTVGFNWSCVRSKPSLRLRTARSSTCCATSPRAPHTLCLQMSSALGRHSFPTNYNTACLLNCFVFLCSISSTLW